MVMAPEWPRRYAITDLASHVSDAPQDRALRLGKQLKGWAVDGVDIIQLREKSLAAGELLTLTQAARATLNHFGNATESSRRPRLLVNSRVDIALAAGADGVHLPAHRGALRPAQVRQLFERAGRPDCLVSVSCHTLDEVVSAREQAANLILFGPVFEKRVGDRVVSAGVGLGRLQEACALAGSIPVLALGGLTAADLPACIGAGARGVAGIRLFADSGVPQ